MWNIGNSLLACPECKGDVNIDEEKIICYKCNNIYPIENGIPVLINEKNSIFKISDFKIHRGNDDTTGGRFQKKNKKLLNYLLPNNSTNFQSGRNFKAICELLAKKNHQSVVLVIGAGERGAGIENLAHDNITLVSTDVIFSPSIQFIVDGHDIPFKSNMFDGVIIQAVLEHVVDPYRVVNEIHRILKPTGIVYSETPFMQQVHMGRYDFTRFTHLGHRRLFRKFTEIKSGVICGPGVALSWSIENFFLSFLAQKATLRRISRLVSRIISFGFILLDRFTYNKPGAFDGASSFYFLGERSDSILSDNDLINQYKGAQKL
jgi:SAM-dependent methyltransferase